SFNSGNRREHGTMKDAIFGALDSAGVYARALIKTRMIKRLHPRALPVLIRSRRAGTSGPSTLFRLNAASQPDKEAVVDETSRRTFAEVDRRIDRLAHGLARAHGLGRGDSAVLLMRNRAEILEIQA